MERELRAYRANPTDRRFAAVYRVAEPWIRSTGAYVLRGYRELSASAALDDLAVEGALAISRSARRFVYLCGDCGAAFVHARDLGAHNREVHRRRGVATVSLATFAKTSARLAMKRTARRLVRAEVLDPDIDLGVDDRAEATILLEVLVRSVGDRLWARAREDLRAILAGDDLSEADVARLRAAVAHIG